MPERERLYCPCPPTGMVDVVGKKWALCVVTLLGRNGTLRYAPIQRALPRVSPATLTHTLRALEANGLVTRAPVTGDARAAGAYALTAQGEALYRSLLPLTSWLRKATPW
ncbi:MAG: helix-turn-helix transcriptional regulator [Nitrososphaerota archaeon]|nr:helix-turn-helix transcriptional regulator [Nitrososphaerota archaeon]